MLNRNGLVLALVLCSVLAGIIASPTSIHAVVGPPPPKLSYCETPDDEGIIGTATGDLGDVIAIPVHIGSDNQIEAFRFRFDVPDFLTFDHAEEGKWEHGFGPWFMEDGYLVIGQLDEAPTPMQPVITDTFLTLYFTTTCENVHNITESIAWAPSDDPFSPTTFLVNDGGCQTDPIETKTNGSVTINPIDIHFSISHDTALVGEEVTVTVSCENEFLFNSFVHRLAVDGNILTYALPLLTPSDRLSAGAQIYWNGPDDFIVHDADPDGFGTSAADGPEFYQLKFLVIENSDDISSAVWFTSLPEVTALDCNQELHNFNPPAVSFENGSVTVPPYEAEFDFGEVEWNNQSTCEFTVPLLLRSNYPINNLRLAVGFTDTDANPLEFIDVTSAYAITGDEFYCAASGLPYALINPNGAISIPPSEAFDTIAHLRFRNDAASSDDINYTLELVEYGCEPDDRTFVESPGYQQALRYHLTDAQLDSDTGGIVIGDPYTSVSVPGCQSSTCKFPPDCEWWAYSGVYVTSNQDLDSIWFDLDWNTDRFCVTLENVDPNLYYSGGSNSSYAMRIDNVTAGPTRHYATVKVTNGKYSDQWGDFALSNTSAFESCTHGSTASSGSGGGIFTYALPLQYASCIPNTPIEKPATVPRASELLQNHPNPFNAGTIIEFTLSDESHVRMNIFNIMGQRVRTLVDDVLPAGEHSIAWDGRTADGREVATGVYLYRMDAGSYTQTRKMVLLK